MKISVVIPCYKCEVSIRPLYDRLKATFIKMESDYEIIMVNDSSPQNDWEEIKKIAEVDNKVIGVNLSRNFGQHYAVTAGIDYCNGNYVVVMDGDLQDRPEEIIKMYNEINRGYDIVLGRRLKRKDGSLKKFSSSIFKYFFEYFTDSKIDNTVSNFGMVKKIVIENIKKYREQNRSYGLFVKMVGFKVGYIEIEHSERFEGKSSYSLKKLINLAIDSIVAYSNKPLRLSIWIGFMVSTISIIYAIYLMMRYFILGTVIQGWTSVMVSVWFLSGLMFANMGILGLYIGKIFDETKARPLYIIREVLNGKGENNCDK